MSNIARYLEYLKVYCSVKQWLYTGHGRERYTSCYACQRRWLSNWHSREAKLIAGKVDEVKLGDTVCPVLRNIDGCKLGVADASKDSVGIEDGVKFVT